MRRGGAPFQLLVSHLVAQTAKVVARGLADVVHGHLARVRAAVAGTVAPQARDDLLDRYCFMATAKVADNADDLLREIVREKDRGIKYTHPPRK